MLKLFINETDYQNLLGCNSIPNNFNELVIDASSYIDRFTMGRITKVDESIKYATCKIVKLLDENENVTNVISENVEGWSRTYASFEDRSKELETRKIDILKSCLDKNLLYQGVM